MPEIPVQYPVQDRHPSTYVQLSELPIQQNYSVYFSWQEIPVGKNPGWNYHRVIPVTVVTEVVAGVITQPRLT